MAAPKNPKNRWSDKAWRDAIRVAVNRSDKGGKKLAQLANALVTAGIAGDVSALKEIGDRLDGKVPQSVVGGDDDSKPIRMIAEVRRTIVDPKADA